MAKTSGNGERRAMIAGIRGLQNRESSKEEGHIYFHVFPSETKVYALFKKVQHSTRSIKLSRSPGSLFGLYYSCLYSFSMAKLVAVCRDEADFAFERRQIPLNIEDTLTVRYIVSIVFYVLRERIPFR